MDDDFTFGASVWGTAERLSLDVSAPSASEPSPAPLTASTQDGFDDFDDFGTPAETIAASGDEADDDFGDFGDFGEGVQLQESPSFMQQTFDEEEVVTPRPPPEDWQALHLDPMPDRTDLQKQIDLALAPLWVGDDASNFSDEPIRQAEGLNQTLITPERYFAAHALCILYLKSQMFSVVNYMTYCCRPRSPHSNQ